MEAPMNPSLFEAAQFTIGDVVRLNSGAPPSMTVISINGDEIETCWGTKSGVVHREKFPAAALQDQFGDTNLFAAGHVTFEPVDPIHNSCDEGTNEGDDVGER